MTSTLPVAVRLESSAIRSVEIDQGFEYYQAREILPLLAGNGVAEARNTHMAKHAIAKSRSEFILLSPF
jgi:hypothetical protein